MTIPNPGPLGEAPPPGRLLRSTLIAIAVATALLVTVVLPAEYGIDPTGVGRVIGLTRMGEIKMALAREVAAAEAAEAAPAGGAVLATPTAPPAADSTGRSEVARVTLAPDQGKELKLAMRRGAAVAYAWATDRGVVNYDAHGDSTNAPNSYYGYGKGNGVAADSGTLVAQFDGNHGWFWRNRTGDTLTITLRVSGGYVEMILPR
jgi:hypothetical protein